MYPSPPPPAPDNPTLAISTLPLGDRPQSFGGFQGRAGLQGATHTWLKDPLCSSTSCRALRVRAFRRGTQGQGQRALLPWSTWGQRSVEGGGGFLAARASPDAQVRSELPPATPVATLPEGWRLPCCCVPRLVLEQAQ